MRRRLERRIYVPPPDAAGRAAMLRIHTKGLRLHEGVDLGALAARLECYSGADVQAPPTLTLGLTLTLP